MRLMLYNWFRLPSPATGRAQCMVSTERRRSAELVGLGGRSSVVVREWQRGPQVPAIAGTNAVGCRYSGDRRRDLGPRVLKMEG